MHQAKIGDTTDLGEAPPLHRHAAAVVEASEDPVIGLALDGAITLWNPAAERLYGYSAEEAIGQSISILVPPELRGAPGGLLAAVRDGFTVRHHETQRMAKDGRLVDVSISMSPITDDSGTIVAAAALTREITSEMEARRRLRRSQAQLAEAQSIAGLGSWEWDVPANEVTWSEQLYRIMGFEPEDFTPTYEGFLATVHPEDLPMVTAEIERAFEERGSFAFDYRSVHPGQREGVIASRGRAITNEAGEVVRMVGTAQDITERHAVDRMKNEFISVVSHELRTPLTSLRGSLGILAGGLLGPLPEKGQRMLDIALQSTDRLVRLIGDILDIERIESGAFTMRKEEIEAGELMEHARQAVQPIADEANVTLSISPAPVQLRADRDRIVQALTNLLSNAIKFSPSKGTVWLWAEDAVDEVLFGVRDQGRGIPADELDSIFERFHQVDGSDSREKGGTGLGLAICRSIAQQHDGRISVESRVGEGSTFSFALPAGKPPPSGNPDSPRLPTNERVS